MFRYLLYVNKFRWGELYLDDTAQSLTLKILPRAVPCRPELVKSIQKKLIRFLELEGFEARRVKK